MLTIPRELIARAVRESTWKAPAVNPADIKPTVQRYKLTFLYLVGSWGRFGDPLWAYQQIDAAIRRGDNPDNLRNRGFSPYARILDRFNGVSSPFVRKDSLTVAPAARTRLPDWYMEGLRTYLQVSSENPHHSFPPDADFSFWLAQHLLRNRWFVYGCELMRNRWLIHEGMDIRGWFESMNGWQGDAVEFFESKSFILTFSPTGVEFSKLGSPIGQTEVLYWAGDEFPSMTSGSPYSGEARRSTPFDSRDVKTYGGREVSFGLPIQDYDKDLDALCWVAGARPGVALWRDWIESLLWSPLERPWFTFYQEPNMLHWDKTWRHIRAGSIGLRPTEFGHHETYGVISNVPFSEATMGLMRDERAEQPGVEFHSRWLNLNDYPDRLLPELIFSVVNTWGTYEAPPGAQNIRKHLETLVKPHSKGDVEIPSANGTESDEDWNRIEAAEREVVNARKRASRFKR